MDGALSQEGQIPDRRWGEPVWFGAERPALAGFVHRPDAPGVAGVVLCPPIGYELWSSHRSFRQLALDLCAAGLTVLRFDYDGTGNSAGNYTDPHRMQAWRDSVDQAVAYLQSLGVVDLALVGLRFGATLAWSQGANQASVQTIVLWDPVVSGRRFVRELKLMAASANSANSATTAFAEDGAADDGASAVAGTVHGAQTLADMGKVDLLRVPVQLPKRVLIIERDDRPADPALQRHLLAQGVDVVSSALPGTAEVLDRATEEAQIPSQILQAIVDALRPSGPDGTSAQPGPTQLSVQTMRSAWNGVMLEEQFLRVGPSPMFGVLCRRDGEPQTGKLVVFLNSGAEHHLGPGRLWVEFGRSLSAQGVATLRVDFNGIGESRLRGLQRRVQPYDASQTEDIQAIVSYARTMGYGQVILLGLCASAWMALHSAVAAQPDALVAINPQLYWKPGDPVPVIVTEFRQDQQVRREALGQRWHLWTALDLLGIRPVAARLLAELGRRRIAVLLAFADGDPGIVYLRTRLGRRFQILLRGPSLKLVEIKNIDHAMHRHRHRASMFEQISRFVLGL